MEQQRIRIHADVYFLEVGEGAVVRNRMGSLEIKGKGGYQLLCWIFAAFDGSRSYAETVAKLPAALEPHARAILGRLLERRFARKLARHERHDEPLRQRFPELYNLLEYRTDDPLQAWQRVLGTTVRISGAGQLREALCRALPDYGLGLAEHSGTPAAALHVLACDNLDDYQREVARLDAPARAALAGGLCRHGGALYALTRHGQSALAGPDCLAALALAAAGASQDGLLPPAARSMAAHALSLALFDQAAYADGREPRLAVVDLAALALSEHRLLPRALLGGTAHGTALAAADGWLRPDLGGSLLADEPTATLNAIAGAVAALCDARVGPVLSIDDGDLFQLPLAAALAHYVGADGQPHQALTLGLSARETRNQGVLAALDGWLAARWPGRPGLACGWSRREALLRAGRALFERDQAAWDSGAAVAWHWTGMPKALQYLAELFDDLPERVRCARNRHGWHMARHTELTDSYGVGISPAQAIGDLLLKLAARRWYGEAAYARCDAVVLRLDADEAELDDALAAALGTLRAREFPLAWPVSPTAASPLYLVEVSAP